MNLLKQNLVFIIVVVLVAIGGIVYVLAGDGKDSEDSHAKASFSAVNACEVLTLDEAKTFLGDDATGGTTTPDSKSADVNVSTCSYTNNAPVAADIKVATLVIRSALSNEGADSNKAVFGKNTPAAAQKVEDFGDEAYFIPSLGQLNILDGNDWIIASYGGGSPSSQTLDNAKAVAHMALDHDGASHDEME